MIFCSFNPAVLKAGLEVAKDKNPLLYAANKDNWKEVGELALEYKVPVVVSAINDLDALKTLAKTFAEAGIKDIVLDPGTYPSGKGPEGHLHQLPENQESRHYGRHRDRIPDHGYPAHCLDGRNCRPCQCLLLGNRDGFSLYHQVRRHNDPPQHGAICHPASRYTWPRQSTPTRGLLSPWTGGMYKVGTPDKNSPVSLHHQLRPYLLHSRKRHLLKWHHTAGCLQLTPMVLVWKLPLPVVS